MCAEFIWGSTIWGGGGSSDNCQLIVPMAPLAFVVLVESGRRYKDVGGRQVDGKPWTNRSLVLKFSRYKPAPMVLIDNSVQFTDGRRAIWPTDLGGVENTFTNSYRCHCESTRSAFCLDVADF